MKSTDRGALTALFRSTGAATWIRKDNWDTDEELWEWYGVGVNKQGRVVKLDLHENRLPGTFLSRHLLDRSIATTRLFLLIALFPVRRDVVFCTRSRADVYPSFLNHRAPSGCFLRKQNDAHERFQACRTHVNIVDRYDINEIYELYLLEFFSAFFLVQGIFQRSLAPSPS